MGNLKAVGIVAGMLVLLVPSSSLRAQDDDTVIKAVSGELMKELLAEEGYKGAIVKQVKPRLHVVTIKMEGKRINFWCDLETGSIQGRFALAGTNANARKINAWNESKKFFKAHLDKDGDPVFSYDLVVKHGVTRKSVKEFASIMGVGMKAFLKEVCE